jgi:hypothetical protein
LPHKQALSPTKLLHILASKMAGRFESEVNGLKRKSRKAGLYLQGYACMEVWQSANSLGRGHVVRFDLFNFSKRRLL